MGVQDCIITLDNQWNTYYPGQTVNGTATFTFDKPKKIRGIYIKFKGEAETRWTTQESRSSPGHSNTHHGHDNQHHGSGYETVTHKGEEEYFNTTYYLVGTKSGKDMELPPGQHSYPFTCTLPPTLPTSFEGEHGHVRYTVKVVLDRPWKFDQETKMAFTVVAHMDLNVTPGADRPIRMEMEKSFCCCCCRSGPLTVDVSIPVSGYVSGQTIPIEINCENGSNVDVSAIKLKLMKTVTYRAHLPRPNTKSSSINIASIETEGVPGNTTMNFSKIFEIPPLPPSSLMNCSIIDLDYELQVRCVVSGMHMNLDDSAPIIIGTVPLVNFQPPMATGETNMPIPTVPPVNQGYPDPAANSAPYPGQPMVNPYPGQPMMDPAANSGPYPGQPMFDTNPPPYPGQPMVSPNAPPYPGQPMYNPSAPADGGIANPANVYPQLAQPVYREGQFATLNIHDSNDGQHTRVAGDGGFAPRYPTYGFVIPPK